MGLNASTLRRNPAAAAAATTQVPKHPAETQTKESSLLFPKVFPPLEECEHFTPSGPLAELLKYVENDPKTTAALSQVDKSFCFATKNLRKQQFMLFAQGGIVLREIPSIPRGIDIRTPFTLTQPTAFEYVAPYSIKIYDNTTNDEFIFPNLKSVAGENFEEFNNYGTHKFAYIVLKVYGREFQIKIYLSRNPHSHKSGNEIGKTTKGQFHIEICFVNASALTTSSTFTGSAHNNPVLAILAENMTELIAAQQLFRNPAYAPNITTAVALIKGPDGKFQVGKAFEQAALAIRYKPKT